MDFDPKPLVFYSGNSKVVGTWYGKLPHKFSILVGNQSDRYQEMSLKFNLIRMKW